MQNSPSRTPRSSSTHPSPRWGWGERPRSDPRNTVALLHRAGEPAPAVGGVVPTATDTNQICDPVDPRDARNLVADWGAPSGPLMRVLFLTIRLVDGFETTADNLAGRLPEIFARAAWARVSNAIATGRLRLAGPLGGSEGPRPMMYSSRSLAQRAGCFSSRETTLRQPECGLPLEAVAKALAPPLHAASPGRRPASRTPSGSASRALARRVRCRRLGVFVRRVAAMPAHRRIPSSRSKPAPTWTRHTPKLAGVGMRWSIRSPMNLAACGDSSSGPRRQHHRHRQSFRRVGRQPALRFSGDGCGPRPLRGTRLENLLRRAIPGMRPVSEGEGLHRPPIQLRV
jgi:hypothetical protein